MLPFLLVSFVVGLGLTMDFSFLDDDDQPGTDNDLDLVDRTFEDPDIVGNQTDNTQSGDNGDNTMLGAGGDDVLSGRGGDDTIYGGEGDDELYGNNGADHVLGGAGDDVISLGNGNDVSDPFIGSREDLGDDTIHGDAGNDLIADVSGSNEIYGDAGNDTLIAIDGISTDGVTDTFGTPEEAGTPDELNGGAGDDWLFGDGNDTLTGGTGEDLFMVGTDQDMSFEAATLRDFNVDEDVFTVVYLDNPDVAPQIYFRAAADNSAVFAYVNSDPIAMLEGLGEDDIPFIQLATTNP